MVEILRHRLARPAEPHAAHPGRLDALPLALPDVFALRLRHVGEDLQDEVGHKRAGQVAPGLPCVEQRHVEHDDVHALVFRDDAPLVQDLLVIAPQPVDGFDHEHIARAHPAQQLPVLRSVEILAAELIHKDVLFRHRKFGERDALPVLVLFFRGYANVPVDDLRHCVGLLIHYFR